MRAKCQPEKYTTTPWDYTGQSTGTLTFRNSQRVTSYGTQVPMRRGAADTRPQLQLALTGAGLSDTLYMYAETGATAAIDAAFDAVKLPNTTGLNLAALAPSGQPGQPDRHPRGAGR